jgi:DNA-binding MarR family transcriptional regulator
MKRGKVQKSSQPREAEVATQRVQGVSIQLVKRTTQLIADRVEDALSGSRITPEQWRVLIHLYEHRGCTMSELATAASLTGPTLTRVVDQLTASALAYRNVDQMDRRRALAYLSSRGHSLVRKLHPRVLEAEAEAVAVLSSTDARELNRILGRIAIASGVLDANGRTSGVSPK